jgi:hypothetical protein
MKTILLIFSIMLILVVNSIVLADEDAHLIDHVIRQQWQKPDVKLEIAPIVVEGRYAIVGWILGERGGRALLRRGEHGWEVFMCGGDDLSKPYVLQQSGIETTAATLLAQKLIAAEQLMSPAARKQFSIFEGVVPVSSQQHVH